MASKQQDTTDIEKMVEAQARGERVAGVATDRSGPKNSDLDTRTSKVVLFADASDDNMADASDDNMADASDDSMADASDDNI